MRQVGFLFGSAFLALLLGAFFLDHSQVFAAGRTVGELLQSTWAGSEHDRRRAADEKNREARFEQAPLSQCGDFGRGGAPQLCLERNGPENVTMGSPVKLRLRWRNLPADQRIRVRVTSAAPVGRRYRYAGPNGAITSKLFGGSRDGDVQISWDGKSIYCAPADLPTMCDAGEIGRFRVQALSFTGDDPFWPSWPPQRPVPTLTTLRSEAPEIEFTGVPRPLSRSRYALASNLRDALQKALPDEMGGSDFHEWQLLDQEPPFHETFFSYCASYELEPPFEGGLELCFPKSAGDQYGLPIERNYRVYGAARMSPGVTPAAKAKDIAERAAASRMLGKVQFDHYPSGRELNRFGAPPRQREDWRGSDEQQAAQKAWESRIVYLQQEQTNARFMGDGRWLVSVDQVARDMGQQLRSDFVTYYFRVGGDRHPCLIAIWNRTRNEGNPPPSREAERTLPCMA